MPGGAVITFGPKLKKAEKKRVKKHRQKEKLERRRGSVA